MEEELKKFINQDFRKYREDIIALCAHYDFDVSVVTEKEKYFWPYDNYVYVIVNSPSHWNIVGYHIINNPI